MSAAYALFEATDASGARGLYAVHGATGGVQELLSGKAGLFSPATLRADAGGHAAPSSRPTIPPADRRLWAPMARRHTRTLFQRQRSRARRPTSRPTATIVVFKAATQRRVRACYWSDGTSAGTREVVAGRSARIASPNFTAFGARALFAAADSSRRPRPVGHRRHERGHAEIEAGLQGVYSLSPSAIVPSSLHAVSSWRPIRPAASACGTTDGTAARHG